MNMLVNPLGSNFGGYRGNRMPNYYPTRIINIVCRGCDAKKGETCRRPDGTVKNRPCAERRDDSGGKPVEPGQQSARECAKAKKLLDDALGALQRALTIESIPTDIHDAITDVQALLTAAKQDLVYLSVCVLPEVPKAAPLLRPEARAAIEADKAQDDEPERVCQGAGLVSSDPTEAERFQIDTSGPLKFSEGNGAGELHRLPNNVQTWEQGSGSATLIGPVTITGLSTQHFPVDGIPGMAHKPIVGTWLHYIDTDGHCVPACILFQEAVDTADSHGVAVRECADLYVIKPGQGALFMNRVPRGERIEESDPGTWHFACSTNDDVAALKAALT